jgi:hypothetical protein
MLCCVVMNLMQIEQKTTMDSLHFPIHLGKFIKRKADDDVKITFLHVKLY